MVHLSQNGSHTSPHARVLFAQPPGSARSLRGEARPREKAVANGGCFESPLRGPPFREDPSPSLFGKHNPSNPRITRTTFFTEPEGSKLAGACWEARPFFWGRGVFLLHEASTSATHGWLLFSFFFLLFCLQTYWTLPRKRTLLEESECRRNEGDLTHLEDSYLGVLQLST